MAQELYELPEQWKWNKLGDVLDVRDGTHDSPKYQQTGYPLVTSKNLTSVGLDLGNVKYISEKDFRFISKRSGVNKGDILFAMIGTIGNPIIIEKQPNFAIKNVALFKPREEFQCMEYFCYFLLSPDAIGRMLSSSKGAAQKFVGLGVLRGFYVPLPPLNEQKRIVAKLNALFTRIDTAITHLQQTLELSKALLASALDEVFASEKNQGKLVSLIQVATVARGKSKHRPRNDKTLFGGNYPFIQTGDVRNAEKYITTYSKAYSEKGLAQSKLWAKGTICLTIAANIGEVAMLGVDACFPDSVVGISSDSESNEYIYYFLTTLQRHLDSKATMAAQKNINLRILSDIEIPLPLLDEQKCIVAHLDALSERTRTLEASTQEKIKNLTALKASLLDAAFKGQL